MKTHIARFFTGGSPRFNLGGVTDNIGDEYVHHASAFGNARFGQAYDKKIAEFLNQACFIGFLGVFVILAICFCRDNLVSTVLKGGKDVRYAMSTT